MSENIVTLTNKKSNELEFEMEVEGLSVKPSDIRFIIETSEMDYAFKCTQKKGKTCTVTIPPLPHLEKTMYPFRIETVIDGYHFTPMKGQVNVTSSFDVYASEPKNKTVAPPKNVEKKPDPKKTAPKKAPEKKTEQKISELATSVTGKVSVPPTNTKPIIETKVLKNLLTPDPATLKDIQEEKVAEQKTDKTASFIDIDSIQADKLVKDAIRGLKESAVKLPATAKAEHRPFFKKVNEADKKSDVLVESKKPVSKKPEPSEKDKAVHALLENKEEKKPAEPTVAFKKGKTVKS